MTRLPVALALGWLFLRRGSIWASFGLHAAFNGVLLVLAELAVNAATGSAERSGSAGSARAAGAVAVHPG